MKHLLQNKDFPLDEILFNGRNKKYGAYVIRNESGTILLKALFIGLAFCATIAVTPFVINAFKPSYIVQRPVGIEHILMPVD